MFKLRLGLGNVERLTEANGVILNVKDLPLPKPAYTPRPLSPATMAASTTSPMAAQSILNYPTTIKPHPGLSLGAVNTVSNKPHAATLAKCESGASLFDVACSLSRSHSVRHSVR